MRSNYYFCNELARGDILAIWKAFMLLSKLTKSGKFCMGGDNHRSALP